MLNDKEIVSEQEESIDSIESVEADMAGGGNCGAIIMDNVLNLKTDPKDHSSYPLNKMFYEEYRRGKREHNEEICKEVLTKVVKKLENYIYKFATSTTYKDTDTINELRQECYLVVCKKFPEYDPDKGSLTNFFYMQFYNAVNTYVNQKTNRIDEKAFYEKMNIVRRSTSRLLSQGIEPTIEAIMCDTGLEEYSVSEALEVLDRSKDVYYQSLVDPNNEEKGFGEAFDFVTKMSSPSAEDECIRLEGKRAVNQALKRQSPAGVKMFLMNYGLGPYAEKYSLSKIARAFGHGMTPAKVKTEIERVRFGLRHDEKLKQYFGIKLNVLTEL